MDVGYYISELLGQNGDVNVPGLGYFAHTRVNGYYNDQEGKFHPPGYSVQYDPQFLDDDEALARHVSDKKKISVASAKYFIEKFVATLKQQAALGKAALADLGWFSTNDTQLTFTPNTSTSTNPAFFGYPQISLHKIGQQPVIGQGGPESIELQSPAETPDLQKQLTDPQIELAREQEEYLINLTGKKRRTNIVVFVVLAILLTALISFLMQRYGSSAFDFSFGTKNQPVAAAEVALVQDDDSIVKEKPNTDSVAIATPVAADSILTDTPRAIKDTSAMPRYEVITGSFKDLKEANLALRNYKTIGITAKIVDDAPGKRVKVSVATFTVRGRAEETRRMLVEAKKIGRDAYTMKIEPRRNNY